MMAPHLNDMVLQSPHRVVLPIAVYPGLALTGAKVSDLVTNPQAQFEAQAALQERYHSLFVLSAMDLSAEAEAFGCTVMMSEMEVPTVTGRLITSMTDAQRLMVPQPGDKRTGVYLETVRLLGKAYGDGFILGGCIGPFSLAARLVGVSEAMELTLTEPELMHKVLEKSTAFLTSYIQAFRAAGARGIIMAEPAAGLLSPRMLSEFSSAWVKRIADSLADTQFTIVLHNCAAKTLHLPAILETGLKTFHFGAPMDMTGALAKVSADVVLCGNLDPTAVFVRATPEEVTNRARALLASTANHRNFVMSSGCDVPPGACIANLDAFYEAGR
jgi:uroporphyrinogen decarboxylase